LEPADRPVMAPLPRGGEPRGPGRADAPDEDQAGIVRLRHLDRELALADFIFTYHCQSSVMFSVLMMPHQRARSASTNFLVSTSSCGFSGGKAAVVSEARNASSPSARLRLARIVCTTCAGTPAGATAPYHTVAL